MCSVFERTLSIDQGKALVHANESSFDTQAMYKSLSKCYEKDTKASLDSSTLLAYMTTANTDE